MNMSIEERTDEDATLDELHRASREIRREMGVCMSECVDERLEEEGV